MASNIDPSLTKNFKFGVGDADAPDLGMLLTHDVTLNYEPENYEKAPDGEGHSIALARTEAKCQGSFVGYVSTPEYTAPFSWTFDGLTFIFVKASKPQPKGKFMEVTVEGNGFSQLS